MKIYPAIDLYEGKAIRLTKGKLDSMKEYGDPLEIAEKFSRFFKRLHIVDIEGAFAGEPRNLKTVEKIIKKFGSEVQIGGGFRSEDHIKMAFEAGVKYVILGTRATDLEFLKYISEKYKGITVSLDAANGKLGTQGWTTRQGNLRDFFNTARKFAKRFVYTDISCDGTLSGIKKISKFWDNEEFIYAGGVSSVNDIKILYKSGFSGAIVGKAIYENKITLNSLAEAEKCLQKE